MQKCMQCGYVRRESDNFINANECPRCGIIYAKWQPEQAQPEKPRVSVSNRHSAVPKPVPVNSLDEDKKPFIKSAAVFSVVAFLIIMTVVAIVSLTGISSLPLEKRPTVYLASLGGLCGLIALAGIYKFGKSAIMIPAFAGIILNAGWIYVASSGWIPEMNAEPVDTTTYEYQLEKAMNEVDQRCPMMVSNQTRLDAVYYETGNKVTFSATMVNIAWKDLPGYGRDDLVEKIKASTLDYIKKDDRSKILAEHRVSITVVIKTNDAVEYLRIKIKPSDY